MRGQDAPEVVRRRRVSGPANHKDTIPQFLLRDNARLRRRVVAVGACHPLIKLWPAV